MAAQFNHFDSAGNAVMVDVSGKDVTSRRACAEGKILVGPEIFARIKQGQIGKGDVLGTARIAGIMATKRTGDLIPLCHPLMLEKASVDFELNEEEYSIKATCIVKTSGRTGVEMEALTGVSTALLTIYDMCKAVSKTMEITQVHLLSKSGGKSGDYHRGAEE